MSSQSDEPTCRHCGHAVANHRFNPAWRAFVCEECRCVAYDPEEETDEPEA